MKLRNFTQKSEPNGRIAGKNSNFPHKIELFVPKKFLKSSFSLLKMVLQVSYLLHKNLVSTKKFLKSSLFLKSMFLKSRVDCTYYNKNDPSEGGQHLD